MYAPRTDVFPRKWKSSKGLSGKRPIRMALLTLMYWPKAPPMSTFPTSASVSPTLRARMEKPA